MGQRVRRMLFASCMVLSGAAAQSAETGFYLSGFGGQSIADVDDNPDLSGQLLVLNLPGTTVAIEAAKVDRNDAAFGAMVGYRAARFLAFEAMYLDLGESRYEPGFRITGVPTGPIIRPSPSIPFPPGGFLGGGGAAFVALGPPTVTTSTRGPALSALGLWPVAEKFDIYGRAGVYFADTVRTLGPREVQTERAESTEEALWGVGAQWRAFDRWSLRLDYHRFENVGRKRRTDETDIELWSLGLLFRI